MQKNAFIFTIKETLVKVKSCKHFTIHHIVKGNARNNYLLDD
jgi:hypothetical protein